MRYRSLLTEAAQFLVARLLPIAGPCPSNLRTEPYLSHNIAFSLNARYQRDTYYNFSNIKLFSFFFENGYFYSNG